MTSGSLKWRLPLVAFVVAVCVYYAIPPFDPDGPGPKEGRIKLGLDLQGGMHLVLRVDTSKIDPRHRDDATARAIEIIRNRIDQFGVSEPSIQREGNDRIVVQLPGVRDRERALGLIGKTALLEFKLVADEDVKLKEALAGNVPEGYELHKSEEGGDLLLEKDAPLTGKAITNAGVSFESQFNEPVVTMEFNAEGAKLFSEITGASVGRRLAIVLDGKVQSAPVINERIPSGKAQITGRFNLDQANDLAIALRAGALPAPIVIEEERNVGPSLGKDSVEEGVRASVIGFASVVAFMAIYYLLGGLVANLALALNILIILAALSYFHATLTLPGIAGAVLTIGMAVDTNVLIFERIREERMLGKPISAAITTGYRKAFATILDSNLTTLITAAILYFMGSGPVKGFALTLTIGLVASMFTGIFVTRAILDLLLAKGSLSDLRMLHFLKQPPKIDYLKIRKICYAISIGLIALGAVFFVRRGEKMFGVEFTGGTLQEYRFEKPLSVDELRKTLTAVGYGTATIQRVGETDEFMVRAGQGSEGPIQQAIKKDFPDNPAELLRLESIGPVVGKELKTKALWAVALSLLGIWIYVIYRFDFKFAFGAILSLLHDALTTVGIVAISGREFSVPVLAAVLTILGYSINDTIVIFDRIRERRHLGVKETFEQAINVSINQTLSRTILTTLTVFMVIVALYFFGGEVINDFAFTMLVGVISGTYSTVYIAAPVLVEWPGAGKK
ncbi:MAG: protein translocase subunit SecD [Candidatus Omnitrophica bacterium]|nr:protein translocase subunit SecD [Candidatus Omnitrophota bacterium]